MRGVLQLGDVLSLQVSLPSKSHSRPHLEALLKAWSQSKAGAAGGHSCTGSMAGFLGGGGGESEGLDRHPHTRRPSSPHTALVGLLSTH